MQVKEIKLKIKRLILKLTGQVSHLKKGVKCRHVWYGNQYGGFYVCPDVLSPNAVVYSFGIGEDISFDRTVYTNHDCHIYGFDPTPKSIRWIKTQTLPEKFHFFEYGISSQSGPATFFLPKNPNHVSGSMVVQNNIDVQEKVVVRMKSFADIAAELGHTHIDILKMDIEGAEYDVIENILNTNIPITQILIEFHDRFVENGKARTQQAIKKLNDRGYEIFAVSDSFEEVSLIHKSAL